MRDKRHIIFISMPFASHRRPSLGLSLLQAKLQESQIPSFIWYSFFPLVRRVGTRFYEEIADGAYPNYYMIGDWIFAPWLMNTPQEGCLENEGDAAYLSYLQQRKSWLGVSHFPGISQKDVELIKRIRQQVPDFFANALNEFDWGQVRFVGFTSVFQQHVASLAFARLLKEHYPHLTIVFGGANVEGTMGRGVLQSFPWVDAVVSGEGENVITPLVEAVLNGEDYTHVPGVWSRQNTTNPPPPRVKMDDLPYPIFDDLFDQQEAADLQDALPLAIEVETSRGCWWGEHSHCTFCGLNHLNMAYRSKSPQRAVEEITSLWARYANRVESILAVDNILDYRYIKTVLPQLAQHAQTLNLFFETKANLKKQQIAALADAHIRYIQPGVESFSTHVLKVMRKGVSALSNVQMLKWCQEYSVQAFWNILWGFPGERPQDYVESNEWASRLFHLCPPQSCAPIRLDRFSPLFDASDELGIKNIKPVQVYNYIFPMLSQQERFDLAYFFDFEYQESPGTSYTADLMQTVRQWAAAYDSASLFYFPVDMHCMVVDTRLEPQLWLLDQTYMKLLDALDAIAIRSELAEHLKINAQLLAGMLHTLDQKQWILQEGNKVLGLPIRLGRYQPSSKVKHLLSTLFDAQTGQATLSGRIAISTTAPSEAVHSVAKGPLYQGANELAERLVY